MSKREQRRIIKARLSQSDEHQRKQWDKLISERLSELYSDPEGMLFLSYMATDAEANPEYFHKRLEEQGARIAYPVCHKNGIMEFRIPGSSDCVKENIFGIRDPVPEESILVTPEQADVILVPCVAFDRSFRRLGHGGGYYDRYLPHCARTKKLLIAYDMQELDSVETEHHDILMDVIVTQTKTLISENNSVEEYT